MKNTKTAIILVIISFVVLCVSSILLNYTSARISVARYINLFFVIASALAMFAISYSLLIKRFKRTHNVVDQSKFAKLYDLENTHLSGNEIQFYFTIERTSHVKFDILNQAMASVLTLKDEEVNSGGHILHFNSTNLANGVYYYALETDNQRTMKKIWINNPA
jgi:hypothetical protein